MKTTAAAMAAMALMTACGAPVKHLWHYQSDLIDEGNSRVLTQWKLVDKGWRPRVKPGKRWIGDFEPYDEDFDKWVIVSTNEVVRPITVVAHSKFKNKIDEMEPGYKKQKALEKASIKLGKNIEKVRKDFEKYRNKAGTQDEREFWQTLLDNLPVPNEEE